MNATATQVSITETSIAVFKAYASDAANWNGNPLVGGNVGGSKEERGNLTQLKKAGLVETFTDEGCTWLSFTAEGNEYAKTLGYSIYEGDDFCLPFPYNA